MERQQASMKKIGIIEDDQGIATTLQIVLEDEGYTPFHISHKKIQDEREFRRFIERHRPPLVLVDIPYPYETNWELYQKLKASKGNSRRKFLPMGTFNASFIQQLDNTLQSFLSKPFDIDELVQRIHDNYPTPRERRRRAASYSVPPQQNLLLPVMSDVYAQPALRRTP